MMLKIYSAPRFDGVEEYCKRRFQKTMQLKKYPLDSYIDLDTALRIYPGTTFFKKLVNSSLIHGFQVNGGCVYIHPEGLFKSVHRMQRKFLKRELVSLKTPDLPH